MFLLRDPAARPVRRAAVRTDGSHFFHRRHRRAYEGEDPLSLDPGGRLERGESQCLSGNRVRVGVQTPCVLVCNRKSDLRFDLQGQRCLHYGSIMELEKSLAAELWDAIRASFIALEA